MENAKLAAVVEIATRVLTNQELAMFHLVATAGWNPKGKQWYPKVAHLFTEADGTKLHPSALEALDAVVLKRVGNN